MILVRSSGQCIWPDGLSTVDLGLDIGAFYFLEVLINFRLALLFLFFVLLDCFL